MELEGVAKALKEGCRLHAFRSGGGLRVVRLEKDEELKGYGEHPHIDDALSHADEDFLAGGREYEDVYGKLKPHYLTGSSSANSDLDAWVNRGRTFDAWWEDDQMFVELHGYEQVSPPDDIRERVRNTGKTEQWKHLVHTYELKRSSGGAVTTRCIDQDHRSDAFMYKFKQVGKGETFTEALANAFKAPQEKIIEQ